MILKLIFILLSTLLLFGCSTKDKKLNERYYQTILCNKLDGEIEYVLKDRTRIDCLTDEYAIEVDFAKNWAESIGQSLYYAHMTKRKPAVGIIIDKKNESRYYKRLNTMANKYEIKLFVIEKDY